VIFSINIVEQHNKQKLYVRIQLKHTYKHFVICTIGVHLHYIGTGYNWFIVSSADVIKT